MKQLKEKMDKLGLDKIIYEKSTPRKLTRELVFCENSTVNGSTARKWFIKENNAPYICSICGQKPEWNNKPLTLIMDHINGKNTDHRLENLRWVCPNCNQQLDTTNGKNKIRKEPVLNYCIDCGKIISRQAKRCYPCDHLKRLKESKFNDITREDLKDLIRNFPFTKIGEQFNLTDNAIRNWCKNLNLPYRSEEIKKYTDEEWKLI